MKKVFCVLATIASCVSYGASVDISKATVVKSKGENTLKLVESGSDHFTLKAETLSGADKNSKKRGATGYALIPVSKVDSNTNGIRFEFKGNGDDRLASIFLGDSKVLHQGFEATFSLKNNQWHEITIPFTDFTPNFIPWNPVKNPHVVSVNPEKLTRWSYCGMINDISA